MQILKLRCTGDINAVMLLNIDVDVVQCPVLTLMLSTVDIEACSLHGILKQYTMYAVIDVDY